MTEIFPTNSGAPPRLAELHRFVAEKALPLWAQGGVHPHEGVFVEHLHMDGTPDLEAVRRMRVQARQIYVYAHATLLGLTDARDLVARAFERMVADYWQAEDGGFILSVAADGQPRDRTQTAYDQAFGLFATAWLYKLTRDAGYLAWAQRILRFMDTRLSQRDRGGYFDSVGAATRCQNPHMHLLEALLALFEASGDPAFMQRADEVWGLFRAHFLDRSIPALREYFDAEWRPDPVTGDRLDPGHHLEWIWLLARYRRHRPQAADDTGVLFEFAMRHGVAADGLVVDEVAADGSVLRGTKRLWPQTEHLKARVARLDGGQESGLGEIDRVCGLLLDHYLNRDIGTWNDQVGETGERLSKTAPASSFYHLFLAYAEVMRVAGP
jgi:mannose-6-phosphate isomerase